MNIATASQVGSSRLKSTPSAWRSSEPPTVVPTTSMPSDRQRTGSARRTATYTTPTNAPSAVVNRQQEHRGGAELADLEAVVADAAAHVVRRRDAQHEHRHPSTDAPDEQPGPRSRRGAEQHAAGARHEAVAESPVRGLLDVDDGRATCRR